MAELIKPLRLKREAAPRPQPTRSTSHPIARVLIDSGLLHIDQEFDFLVPQELADIATAGVVVKVPFNRKRVLGVVISRHDTSEFRGELRFISEAVRPFPLIGESILSLSAEIKRYYGGTRWDVLRFALPNFTKSSPAQQPSVMTGTSARATVRPSRQDPRYPAAFWEALQVPPTANSRVRAFWTPPPYEDPFIFLRTLLTHSSKRALLLLPDASDVDRMVNLLSQDPDLHDYPTTIWHSNLSRSERERAFMDVLHSRTQIVIGVRGAVLLPLNDLDLIVMWDEGSDTYSEQRAPYYHAREVAILRAHIQKSHLILAGCSPSMQSIAYLRRNYFTPISPRSDVVPRTIPNIQAINERNDPNELGRIPTKAWKIIQRSISSGPVLVQVPLRGYYQSLSCNHCRNQARCRCGGKLLVRGQRNLPECHLCSSIYRGWSCQFCAGSNFRFGHVGDIRVVEELGKAFPNYGILSSNKDHRIYSISDKSIIVVATPGAEPIAESGYAAAVILNSALLLERSSLDAEEEARRRWFTLLTLLRTNAPLFIDADVGNRNIQALQRWDALSVGFREFEERKVLRLPPADKALSISGTPEAISEIIRSLPESVEVSRPQWITHSEPTALIRINTNEAPQIVEDIFKQARMQSAQGRGVARIAVDPITL